MTRQVMAAVVHSPPDRLFTSVSGILSYSSPLYKAPIAFVNFEKYLKSWRPVRFKLNAEFFFFNVNT